MSDTVLVTLIVAAAVLIAVVLVVFLLRGAKLKRLHLKAARDGVDASVETHEPPMQQISGNRLDGDYSHIRTQRGDTNIQDNTLAGKGAAIDAKHPGR